MHSSYSIIGNRSGGRETVAGAHVALAISLVLATVIVLFWRKPDQFLLPAIWAEDSTILGAFAERGWRAS